MTAPVYPVTRPTRKDRVTVFYEDLEREEASYVDGKNEYVPVLDETYNLVGSKLDRTGNFHSPVLDIDFEASLLPSSTPGHYHLYLDGLVLPWWKYRLLLRALALTGVIEKGYANVSISRHKQSFVRRPGAIKRKGTLALTGPNAGKMSTTGIGKNAKWSEVPA